MEQELTEAFRRLKKRDVDTFPAVVVSVDKEQGTCVISADGLELPDVQLSAIIDGSDKKLYLFPKVGSSVLVSPINEDLHRLYVEQYSEIESLDLTIDRVRFQVDKDGFLMQKENETSKALMVDSTELSVDAKAALGADSKARGKEPPPRIPAASYKSRLAG